MVTLSTSKPTTTAIGHKRALLLGLASMAMMGLTPAAQAHVLMAGSNPFIRTDRALNRLTRLMDDLVNAEGLPAPVQPLWRRVVQHQTDMSQPLGADGTAVLAFRAEALETPDSYIITADLPGVRREDIRIAFLDGHVLGITASRHNPYETAATAATTNKVEEKEKDKHKAAAAAGGDDIEIAKAAGGGAGSEEETAWPKYLMREIAYGKQYRGFKLPSDASPETTSAKFDNGVLTVTVAKRQAPKEKLIEIK